MILRVRGVELKVGRTAAVFAVQRTELAEPAGLVGVAALAGVGIEVCDQLLPGNDRAGHGAAAEQPHAGVLVQHGQHLDVHLLGDVFRLFQRGNIRRLFRLGDAVGDGGQTQLIARTEGVVRFIAVSVGGICAVGIVLVFVHTVVGHQKDAALAGQELFRVDRSGQREQPLQNGAVCAQADHTDALILGKQVLHQRTFLCTFAARLYIFRGEIALQTGWCFAKGAFALIFILLFTQKAGGHPIARLERVVRHIRTLDLDAVAVKGKVRQQQRQQGQQQRERAKQACQQVAAAVEPRGRALHIQQRAAAQTCTPRRLFDGDGGLARKRQTHGIEQRDLQPDAQGERAEYHAAQQESEVHGQHAAAIEPAHGKTCGQIAQRQADEQRNHKEEQRLRELHDGGLPVLQADGFEQHQPVRAALALHHADDQHSAGRDQHQYTVENGAGCACGAAGFIRVGIGVQPEAVFVFLVQLLQRGKLHRQRIQTGNAEVRLRDAGEGNALALAGSEVFLVQIVGDENRIAVGAEFPGTPGVRAGDQTGDDAGGRAPTLVIGVVEPVGRFGNGAVYLGHVRVEAGGAALGLHQKRRRGDGGHGKVGQVVLYVLHAVLYGLTALRREKGVRQGVAAAVPCAFIGLEDAADGVVHIGGHLQIVAAHGEDFPLQRAIAYPVQRALVDALEHGHIEILPAVELRLVDRNVAGRQGTHPEIGAQIGKERGVELLLGHLLRRDVFVRVQAVFCQVVIAVVPQTAFVIGQKPVDILIIGFQIILLERGKRLLHGLGEGLLLPAAVVVGIGGIDVPEILHGDLLADLRLGADAELIFNNEDLILIFGQAPLQQLKAAQLHQLRRDFGDDLII